MMRKNMRRAASLLVSLSLCASAFAGITAHGFDTKFTGWNKNISNEYSWMKNATEEEQAATHEAMADELKFQNEDLGFRLGTDDNGNTNWNLSDADGWSDMVHRQMDNHDKSFTDNTTNPWISSQPGRYWCVISAPFAGIAFVVKGDIVLGSEPKKPALRDQYEMNGTVYQTMWDNVRVMKDGAVSILNVFPGMGADGKDIANNTLRYAVAKYDQDNKRGGSDKKGLFAGYPTGPAAYTEDGTIIYQELTGPSGKAYAAVKGVNIEKAKHSDGHLIPNSLVAAFDKLGSSMDARFAVTGAPTGDYADGSMAFENGVLEASGFKKTLAQITAFSFGNDEAAPVVIDEENHTITAYVKESANLASLTPTVTINGASYSPTGAQNFTDPVTYTVTAEKGNTETYTVTVMKLSAANISTFKIDDAVGQVDWGNKTVTILVHADVDLKNVTPEVTFVGDGGKMEPATLDLSKSWDNPVEVKVTSGSASETYKIKARNMNTDNSIKGFTVEKANLRYATSDLKATVDNSAKTISMVYPWGTFKPGDKTHTPYAEVPVKIDLPAGATISPDPSEAKDQLGRQYVVTSEDGGEAVYTVQITMSTDRTIPAVDKLDIYAKNNWNRFSGAKEQAAEFQAILDEYNYQRTVRGFDPGDISGGVEGWGEMLSRQFFVDGHGTNGLGDGNVMIAADVCFGKAYTMYGTMFNAWTNWEVKDEDGNASPGHDQSGCPTENEFKMGDITYQQFSMSYGLYDSNGRNSRVANGVGTSFSAVNTALKDAKSPFYDEEYSQISKNIRNTFRDAYEGANKSGVNPGIALEGNMKFDADHHILYQVFSGTGAFHSEERDPNNKTIIFKGLTPGEDEDGNAIMTGNGSAIALLPEIQKVYENINFDGSTVYAGVTNEYENVSLEGFDFKYSKTLGMPNVAPEIQEDGTIYLEFAKGFATYDPSTKDIFWTDGNRKSSENRIDTIEVAGNAEVEITSVTDENKDDADVKKLGNAIRIHFAAGEKVDLENVVINKVNPVDSEHATVEYNGKTFEDGTALNLSYSAMLKVVAENGGGRQYKVFAWQNGKALSKDDPEYKTDDDITSGDDTQQPGDDNSDNGNGGTGNNGEDPYEYGYYDENNVWHQVTKDFYDKYVGQGGNAKTGDAGVVGIVLLTAVAAGALVVLRKKK